MSTSLVPASQLSAQQSGNRDFGFAAGILLILMVLFLPLPAVMIDMGLALSIALSVLILMVALWIQKPLEFSAFPTVLLIATLLRLSLNIATVRLDLEQSYPTLHLVGRNGMHKYNNQDHAMMTAMLTAKNILAGRRVFDIWAVNEDAEYHEAGASGIEEALRSERLVPRTADAAPERAA